jgi:hypothetical protein
MKTILYTLILASGINITLGIDIQYAINKGMINAQFEKIAHKDEFEIKVDIKNKSSNALEIEIRTGCILISEDSSSQAMVVKQDYIVKIQPQKNISNIIKAYCINSYKAAPHDGEKFRFYNDDYSYLTDLLKFAQKEKVNSNDTQLAIWACVNGKKHVYPQNNALYNTKLKEKVLEIYKKRLASGSILEDNDPEYEHSYLYKLQGSVELFVKEKGKYSAYFEDSIGNKLYEYFSKNIEFGFIPIRYMYQYTAPKEQSFYISIYKDEQKISTTKATYTDNPLRYVKISAQNNTIFNIRKEQNVNLDLVDSLCNVYINFYKNKKMYKGITPYQYSYTTIKPINTRLYLLLRDTDGNVLAKQPASDVQHIKPLTGYAHIKLNKKSEAIFGLYNAKNELIEEFDTKVYNKGLQYIPYGFLFDTKRKDKLFLKLIDIHTNEILYSEPVYTK